MTFGISKRDRLARRGDKRWRSTWHRQMLSPNRTRPIDKRNRISLYSMADNKPLLEFPITPTLEENKDD